MKKNLLKVVVRRESQSLIDQTLTSRKMYSVKGGGCVNVTVGPCTTLAKPCDTIIKPCDSIIKPCDSIYVCTTLQTCYCHQPEDLACIVRPPCPNLV